MGIAKNTKIHNIINTTTNNEILNKYKKNLEKVGKHTGTTSLAKI